LEKDTSTMMDLQLEKDTSTMMISARPYLATSEPTPTGCVRVLVDSGSTCNCYNTRRGFHEERIRDPSSTSIGGCNPNAPLQCKLNSDISLVLHNGQKQEKTVLPPSEFMYVPDMPHMVISTGYYLDEHGIDFDYKAMLVRMPDGQTAHMYRHGQLFYVHAELNKQECHVVVADQAKRHALLWHSRFGGLDVDTARELHTMVNGIEHGIDDNAVEYVEKCRIDASAIDECEIQKLVRMRTPSQPGSTPAEKKAQKPAQRVILDGWPMAHAPSAVQHHTYLMLAADEFSGTGFLQSTIEHKAANWILYVQKLQATFQMMIDDQAKIQAVRVDNSGEFRNVEGWEQQLTRLGIAHENSPR